MHVKVKNDMDCRPIKDGHLYEFRRCGGWITVNNYDLDNGLHINLMRADIDVFTNRDMISETNYFFIPINIRGAMEITYGDGSRYTYLPGSAIFGLANDSKKRMEFSSHAILVVGIGYNPYCRIPVMDRDPDVICMLSSLRDRLGTGFCKPYVVPPEAMILAESIQFELESNRCRNMDYIGKRSGQLLHVLYNMPKVVWSHPENTGNDRAVDRICYILTNDLSGSRTIKSVCDEIGVNEFWFMHNFHKRYGMNPAEYIVRAKHIRAAALLLTGKYSVSEVIGMVGYSSRSQFTAAFKKINGCTPTTFVQDFDRIIECYPEKIEI